MNNIHGVSGVIDSEIYAIRGYQDLKQTAVKLGRQDEHATRVQSYRLQHPRALHGRLSDR